MSMHNTLNGSQPDAGPFKRLSTVISKCLQFLINGLKLSGSFFKFFVEGANILLLPPALGNIIVCL